MSEPAPESPSRSLAGAAFSGAAWLSILNGLAGLVAYGLNMWLNRALPDAPVAMGTWLTVLSLVLMTSLVLDAGIPVAIMQKTELSPGGLAALAWLQVSLGLVGSLALWALAGPLASLYYGFPQAELASAFRLAAPAVLLITLGLPPKAVLQRSLRFRLVATIESCSTLALVAIGVAFAPRLGVTALVLGMVVRHGLETALYWSLGEMRISDLFVGFDLAAVAERLRFGVAMGLQGMLGTAMRQGDRLLVGILIGPVGASVYQQLQLLVAQPFAKLSLYVARAAFPTFARAKDDPERILRGLQRMQRLLSMAVFPALAGMAAVAPRMLHVVLGHRYADEMPIAVPSFQILCLGTIALNYGFGTGVALNAIGLSRPMLLRQALSALAVAALVVAGSPWGVVGISAGRAIASVVAALLLLDLARRQVRFTAGDVASSLRETAPATLACFVVASAVGLAFDHALPASSAGAGPLRSDALFAAALASQVLAGAAAYAGVLVLRGVRPAAELKGLVRRA